MKVLKVLWDRIRPTRTQNLHLRLVTFGQVAHLHNAARALSSPNRCFQLSTNLGKDFFRYLWYCDKKANRMWFSVVLVKFHWFGINWHVFNQSECRNFCLYFIIQKIAPQTKSRKYFQIWFFPRFGGNNSGVLSMRMQVILDSSFSPTGWALICCGKKGEFRDWTTLSPLYQWLAAPPIQPLNHAWNQMELFTRHLRPLNGANIFLRLPV